jgi:YebC/PmpR family DNA-binding regulatory protein
MEKAKEVNMPQENTMRAIKKGTGELPGAQYESCIYEGYGPYGIAVIVDTLTDNKNRTVAEMRRLFSSHGGSLGESGSVAWMFDTLGAIRIAATGTTEEQLLDTLIEYEIHDIIENDDNTFSILCDPKELYTVKTTLEDAGITVESAQLEQIAKTPTDLPDEQAEKVYTFLEALDDHDDVQNVSSTLA